MKRLDFPATGRNRDAILDVLRDVLPVEGRVLEVASGSGQHVVHFAAALPGLRFVPSDPEPAHRESVRAWVEHAGVNNVAPPIALDATAPSWPLDGVDAVFCANMIHIAPWRAAVGLFAGAGRVLVSDGLLVLYGPFRFGGDFSAPSNAAFDRSLRARDPSWGVRDIDELTPLAAEHGLVPDAPPIALPANNHVLLYRKAANL